MAADPDWFAHKLLAWFDDHGRKDLPWQHPITPYRVWVAEIMLQQTQVTTVIDYYQRFMTRFPDATALAAATLDEVLHHWTGLGYYARARNLHKAARMITQECDGVFPATVESLCALPGIGRSTAGAIAAIAFDTRAAILDGNVKRVLARFHAVEGHAGTAAVTARLWAHAEAHTPGARVTHYTQAVMDLGATLCTRSRPACARCPVAAQCVAHARGETARFPEPRPRRAIPVRAARMFLIIDAHGQCLLEQRPQHGLWGGLWTPPERPPQSLAPDICQALAIPATAIKDVRHGARFRHTFTHFHLDLEPVYVRLEGVGPMIQDRPELRWYAPHAPSAIGLAAPAAKLLASLTRTDEEPRNS